MAGLAGTRLARDGRLGLPAVDDPEAGRIVPPSIAPTHATLARQVDSPAGPAGWEGVSKILDSATDSRKNQRHAERGRKRQVGMNGGDRPDSTNRKGSCHKRRDPRAGNTAKGRRNPMNVAGSKMTRSGPVVPGSEAMVAERRAKERPRCNAPLGPA
jgi:hypothetical protein